MITGVDGIYFIVIMMGIALGIVVISDDINDDISGSGGFMAMEAMMAR